MTCWLCWFETNTNAKAPICKDGPCQICTEVIEVDEEINQAVATLRRLLAKRSERNRVHGTIIHRLPVELKNRIFELLLPSRDEWGEIVGNAVVFGHYLGVQRMAGCRLVKPFPLVYNAHSP